MAGTPAWLGIDTEAIFTDFVWYEPSTNELRREGPVRSANGGVSVEALELT
jgi:hypothetical protein